MESEINMNMFRLERTVKLFKPQFDYFNLNRTGEYELDRVSLELDSILFRIKYMIKKGYTGYMELENVFTEKAIHLRKLFGEFMYDFLVHIITIPSECHIDDIHDVLAKDVKINTTHVSFIMTLVSPNKKYLEFVDKSIPDGIMNMFPYKYFRFQTDSYNDAISKAFPELFANKRQNVIGVGDDKDVFVHNLTFQTTERCSLNCTYCFTGETEVLMADGSHKRIDAIKVGDVVAGFKEKFPPNDLRANLPAEVTQVFHHRSADVMKLSHSYIMDTYITANHKVATTNGGCRREWLAVNELQPDRNPLLRVRTTQTSATPCFAYNITAVNGTHDVYNIETTTHTYVANNLAVHNCYQFNKSPMRMEFNTAKKFIDHLLNDDYGYINRYNSPAIIIEFIGGEPLLEIKLTRQIYEYFLDRCYELNHPWFTMHRVSICSNGLQYFDEDVQEFFKEYASNISFNISIDGNRQLHDSCRIQPNGEGSYDIAMASLNHFNKHYTSERNSKMTLAPSNIKYLFESVVDFISNGMKCINLNCVFEEGWTPETAKIEYYQLKQLADYLIDNNMENIFIALFTDRQEGVQDKHNDGSFCGGAGSMTAIRPNGQIYPCIRYMPTSVGDDVPDLCMGSVDDGWVERSDGSEVIKILDSVTRRGSSNDICFNCPLSNNCPNCTALGLAVYGTPNHRTTFHCIQHIAEALANVYYWNSLILVHPEWDIPVRHNVVPDQWAKIIIDDNELEMLKDIEQKAINAKKTIIGGFKYEK